MRSLKATTVVLPYPYLVAVSYFIFQCHTSGRNKGELLIALILGHLFCSSSQALQVPAKVL